ncbi:MAG TPA: TraB/GumN family protein [Gammaproteobacteria bacterium]|nr:TraB/GumN family protein [Gammaproteobacteria bacterium]
MNGRPRSRFQFAALLVALALATPASAQTGAAGHPTIEEITVIGRYPGPPLWKVTSGARTLWVFGELSPVPKGLDWDPRNAERVLDRAGAVIGSPRVSAMTLNPIRVFRLYRGARRLIRLPEDATLADQMPPDLYARYAALRTRYLPKVDEKDEELRPALAVLQLYRAALDDTGLTSDSGVGKTLARKMRRSKAEEAEVVVETEPETVLEELKKITPEAELSCFEAILTTIETDLEGMKERANAWAIGDVDALKRFDYPDSQGNCLDALVTVEGFAELRDELYGKWLSEAEQALATYDTSFSVLPMRELVADDGLLAQLAARGYTVTAP